MGLTSVEYGRFELGRRFHAYKSGAYPLVRMILRTEMPIALNNESQMTRGNKTVLIWYDVGTCIVASERSSN